MGTEDFALITFTSRLPVQSHQQFLRVRHQWRQFFRHDAPYDAVIHRGIDVNQQVAKPDDLAMLPDTLRQCHILAAIDSGPRP